MPLSYLSYVDSEVYEQGSPGSRFSFKLSSDTIEQTVEYQATPDTKGYLRLIWHGSFKYTNNTLSESRITDFTYTAGDTYSWSAHFKVPAQNISDDILQYATSINYNYHSQGLQSSTGRSGGGYDLLVNYPVSIDKRVTNGYPWSSRIESNWWVEPFQSDSTPSIGNSVDRISSPNSYGKETADIITNYNPKTDSPIQIDLASFEGATGKLKIAKRSKQIEKLAKKETDFIYDQQAGYLYFNENGKQPGFGDGGVFAILEGSPKAAFANFQFI